MHTLAPYFARQIIEKLDLKENIRKLSIQIIDLMNDQNLANVAKINETIFPLSQPASANTQLNRLLDEIKKAAQSKQINLKVEITKTKKGGAQNRWVWFEGLPEVPEAKIGELNGINKSEFIADQRGLPRDGFPVLALITFNEHETSAVIRQFHPNSSPETSVIDGVTYNILGIHGGMKIVHRVSRQGEAEAQISAQDAISGWQPKAIIGVGIAFGMNNCKQNIGDVLISEYIRDYELGRIGLNGSVVPRGAKAPVSYHLLQRFNHIDQTMKSNPDSALNWPRISIGTILSGNKLIDDLDYRENLRKIEVEAIGGEMEGTGIFTAAHRHKIDWIIVKAICDWADGNKNNSNKERDQKKAAENAALVVKKAIDLGNIYPDTSPSPDFKKKEWLPSAEVMQLNDHDKIPDHCLIKDILAHRASLKKELSHESQKEGVPVMDHLLDWINDPEDPQLFCLLGEYGMGKTVTSQRLAKNLAELRKEKPSLPMPLYFDLRNVTGLDKKVPSLRETLEECMERGWVQNSHTPKYTMDDIFMWMEQPVVIIIDGLDEVLVKLRESDGQIFTRSLLEIGSNSQKGQKSGIKSNWPKILISCRTQYFRTLRDQQNHFTGQERGGFRSELYKALVLLPLNDKQIRTYLKHALPDSDTDRIIETIESIHNLKDLAHRPYTLRLVSELIPDIEQDRMSGKTIYGVTLYRHMVRRWLERDSGKHHITVDHKLRLSSHLAAHLWKKGSGRLLALDIETWFHEWLESNHDMYRRYKSIHPDQLEEDLRTATFLARVDDQDGSSFRFSHTSLMEYFLAEYLFDALTSDFPEQWVIPMPSKEALDFLGQLLKEASDQKHLKKIRSWGLSYVAQKSELILAYALEARKRGWPAPDLNDMNFAGANLSGWEFESSPKKGSELILKNVCFKGANLRNCRFINVDLSHADFSEAVLDHANILSCKALGADFTNTECTATIFRQTLLQESRWMYAKGFKPQFLLCQGLPDSDFFNNDVCFESAIEISESSWSRSMAYWQGSFSLSLLNGHNSSLVSSCAFSPEGNRLVSAGYDNTLRLWDVKTGDVLLVLKGHTAAVSCCAFSQDGARVVSAGYDNTLRLWDASTGAVIFVFKGHIGSVSSCAFSPDRARVVSAGYDGTLRLWDVIVGKELMTLDGHKGSVNCSSFSPDGNRLVSAGYDGTLRLWDAKTGEMLMILEGHESWVSSCAFSPNGAWVVSCGHDKTVRLWDAQTGEMLMILEGHESWVSSCTFSPDGDRIVSNGEDCFLRLWDAHTGEMLIANEIYEGYVLSCSFSPKGDQMISAGIDSTLCLWDAHTGALRMIFGRHESWIRICIFSPQGDRVISAGDDSTLCLWDVRTGKFLMRLAGHEGAVFCCAFSPDGIWIVSAGSDRTLRLWDAQTGEMRMVYVGHEDKVQSCAFSPDGAFIISGGADGTVRIWDVMTDEMIMTYEGHNGRILSCVFSPDGDRILSAGDDSTLRLWDVRTGDELMAFKGHEGIVRCCAFSPWGDRVVSAGLDNTLRLWDTYSGTLLMTLEGHEGSVLSCAFSNDGEHIVSSGADGTMRLWDAMTGQMLRIHAFTDYWSKDPGHAVWDVENNHLIEACGDIWRSLVWVRQGFNGWPERLPLEIFGPMPAPKRMKIALSDNCGKKMK